MKVSHAYFVLAAISVVSGAALAMAQYQDSYCFTTPVPVCAGQQCPAPPGPGSVDGCPVTNNWGDLCLGTLPVPGYTEVTYYQCFTGGPMTCNAGTQYCGGLIYECNCWKCSCSYCVDNCNSCGGTSCEKSDKYQGCGQTYGCSNS